MQSDTLPRILDRIGEQSHGPVLELLGPTVEFLTPPDRHAGFCVMRGVIPPGRIVPLHSHDDIEAVCVISGSKQALTRGEAGLEWRRLEAGDYVHLESGAPHAWRNDTTEPVVDLLVTTSRIGRFFQEVGRPRGSTPRRPLADELARFAAVAAKYGFWLATPEENASFGMALPTPALGNATT